MPKVLEKLVTKLKKKRVQGQKAYAIATNSLQKTGKLKKAKKKKK